jgi:hypothetical protein
VSSNKESVQQEGKRERSQEEALFRRLRNHKVGRNLGHQRRKEPEVVQWLTVLCPVHGPEPASLLVDLLSTVWNSTS